MPRLPIESCSATHCTLDGRSVLNFGGCNYLGFTEDPRIHAAAMRGMKTYGLSTTASRETTGNTFAHTSLETELAAFFGMESAILTTEGYTANMALCETLGQSRRFALIDEKAHRSVGHAAEAAGFKVLRYRHRDAVHAAEIAKPLAHCGGVVILTDGVFTADGVIAPLPDLLAALPDQDSLLIVDDCHGFCVLGKSGRGTLNYYGLADPRLVITTTLAKGLGCYGGVIAGPAWLVNDIQNKARIYRGTTPCPPPMIEAARAALAITLADPDLAVAVLTNAARLRTWLVRAGAQLNDAPTPIIAFYYKSESDMDRISAELLALNILAPVIEYPGGPANRYFRITVTARHTAEQIDTLGRAFLETSASRPEITVVSASQLVA